MWNDNNPQAFFMLNIDLDLDKNEIILDNGESQLTILPKCGGILNQWLFNTIDIIDGYEHTEDFMENCENKGFRSVKLSPYVCRIQKDGYSLNGVQYPIGKYKLNGLSIHGLLYNEVFTVKDSFIGSKGATVILEHHYNGNDEGYPFAYEMLVNYTLDKNNELTIATKFTNKSTETIPVADGWHPYFKIGDKVDELKMKLNTNRMVVFDGSLIPTGELNSYEKFATSELIGNTELDNCFTVADIDNPLVGTITNEASGIKIEISNFENYPYFQIYTPPHRQSIAFENLSASPDAFNNKMGLKMLQPNETVQFTCGYKVAKL